MKSLFVATLSLLLAACSGSSSPSSSETKSASYKPSSASDPFASSSSVTVPLVAPFICASLSGSSEAGCADPHEGLAGSIYALNGNPPAGIQPNIGYVINQGALIADNLHMADFDVPTRNFTEGFPEANGSLLTGLNGQPLIAFFALDLNGYFTLGAPYSSGAYQFAFFVDDGAILSLDNQTVLNFDGYHSPQWACAPNPVQLNVGDAHHMHLQYFQGPPTQIALRVLMRPYNPNQPCSDISGFQAVPGGFLSN